MVAIVKSTGVGKGVTEEACFDVAHGWSGSPPQEPQLKDVSNQAESEQGGVLC